MIDAIPLSLALRRCAALLAAPALAQTTCRPPISVSGEASVSVAPDLAQIDAGVATDAKTAREASDANNAAMGKVLLALKGAGIDEKDYQTSRLSLQPQYAQPTPAAPARRRSSAIAPPTASPSRCATSPRSPASSTRWSPPAPTKSAASISW